MAAAAFQGGLSGAVRILICVLFALPLFADAPDPEFARYPVAQWLTRNHPAQIHWSLYVLPSDLSTHQRLIQRITLRLEGRELEKRRAGDLTGLIEYRDANGHTWQNHSAIDQRTMHSATHSQYVDLSFYAFVLPGDYTAAIAIVDPKTLEHSAALRKFHVPPVRNDPLPSSWSGLPPVEVIPGGLEPPDIWFLKDIETRLNLPLESKRPLHIQLLLNATPSGKTEGSASAVRENMAVLIPALKVLSQLRLKNGTIDAAMLDLTRRQVAFGQRGVDTLDWDLLRRFFLVTNPGIIDIQTLAGRMKMLGFFRDEITKRLAARDDGAVQVVIVLSGPAFFEDQEPVESGIVATDPGRQLIYIRYRSFLAPRRYPAGARGPGRFGAGRFPTTPLPALESEALIPPLKQDDLEKIAESLNARIFDAATTLQFRRILGAVRDQLSQF
jgi:hypothetical protein